ncbi:MAG: adenine deaminase [Deltaproteobacteria bacterium]|nr:MAG: adenine deaminase [Deltaproteobacteria bacterium]
MTDWQERLAKRLEAARGERPVDLLFRGGRVVNVFNGELTPTSVAVFDGIVVGFGDRPAREVADVDTAILAPGFIDGHVHLESSLLVPGEFARAVVPHGTTAVIADPHEIANVAGMQGIRFMLEASEAIGLEVFYMAPSCVPATPLETSGAELSGGDLEPLTTQPRVLGLAEVMNFPGVVHGEVGILDKLERFRHKIIDGHSPGLGGAELDAYLSAGIGSDHECTQLEEANEKLAKGMHIMLREGSQARDLETLAPLVNSRTAGRCMLVSDDCHPEDLLENGHMNRILNRAMDLGLDPVTAIQLATCNPAGYFRLRSLGGIGPGYQADIVVLRSLQPLEVEQVYKKGTLVAEKGRWLPTEKQGKCETQLISMNLREVKEEDFRIRVEGRNVRVIRLAADSLITGEEIVAVPERGGEAVSQPDKDLLKLAVIERHRGSGRRGVGFVRGFGFRRGALASTVAHDSHNLVVVGANDSDMAVAANVLRKLGGGLVVVNDGQVRAKLPLPVAGLMSTSPLEEVVAAKIKVNQAAHELGATVEHPFMALSFLALPVIPKLKLTDQGLVDVENFTHVPLFV